MSIDLPCFPETARFFAAKMVKGGPDVALAVWEGPPWIDGQELDRSPRLQALVRTETTSRAVIMMGVEAPVEIEGVWLRNIRRVTKADYLFLANHANYSTAHAPENPDASPTEAIDFNKMEPIF